MTCGGSPEVTMRRRGDARSVRGVLRLVALFAVAGVAGGCVYFNSLYNAERLFDEAERDRLAGREELARARYDSVVAKAAKSFRKEPEGEWADDALYLLGRAYFRRDDLEAAAGAFQEVREKSVDPRVRRAATLYLGAIASRRGERSRGIRLLNEALRALEPGPLLGEGHFWRARSLLSVGQVDAGWWDLDRATEADERLRIPADLERVQWGVVRDDTIRARLGVSRLLNVSRAHVRSDTLRSLVGLARSRWGPAPAAALLSEAEDSPWPPTERDRMLLFRADLRLAASDTAAAVADLGAVAEGVAHEAAEARRRLADLELGRMARVAELERVRTVLLPAVGDPSVLDLLEAMRQVEILRERGEEPGARLALFAAAEMARDVLDAPLLARNLYLLYADRGSGPWVGKALLAAHELAIHERDRERLRRRLDAIPSNPYVRAARRGSMPEADFRRLESTLQEELDRLLADAEAEAARMDVILRERGDTVG